MKADFEETLRTIFSAMLVAVMLWVGSSAQQTAVRLERLDVSLTSIQKEVMNLSAAREDVAKRLTRLEAKLDAEIK